MSGRRTKSLLLVLTALVTIAATMSAVEAQPFILQTVTSSFLSSPIPSPSPSPTPSIEERIDMLESQVAGLKEEINISQFKEVVDIIQSAVTVIAMIVGGIWSYWLFVKNRQRYPRAGIAHHITHRRIGNDKLLLHVSVAISNVGDVLLSLVSLETRIQQVLPLSDKVLEVINKGQNPVSEGETEVAWPLIDSQKLELERGDCEVEPGESQEIHHDFILDAETEAIEVYTYLINEQKRTREIAWDLTTLYELDETEEISLSYKEG
jgi:hypothetical protein